MRWPAPEAAAALYVGDVMHARMKPAAHRFTYRVANLLIDIGRLDDADRISPLFRVNRPGLVSFHERDHGPCNGTPLRVHIERAVAAAGVDLVGGRVLLLCYPRLLGYVFNPLSVYWCYDARGDLAALVYEVRNTFGDIHTYVAPLEEGQTSVAGIRQERDKLFYVSPFVDMPMRYHFRLSPPGDGVRVRILETDRDGPLLAATFSGQHRTLTTSSIVRTFAALPFMTLKVIGAIHAEAARLWLKGVPFFHRPSAPAPLSYHGVPRGLGPAKDARPRNPTHEPEPSTSHGR